MIQVVPKNDQAYGAFNNGEIVENKPIGFNREGGKIKPYSNIFYWANAIAQVDSTIGLHPHQGFEIMSFVLEGKIRHFDTQLNSWKELSEGDVQIIRAGNGISHAEHMGEGSRMFQIWFDPDLNKTLNQPASYDDYQHNSFVEQVEDGVSKRKMVGPGAPIQMDSPDLKIERWEVESSAHINLDSSIVTSIYILSGNPVINQQPSSTDDFILVKDETKLTIEGNTELFIIQSPVNPGYKTYSALMKERMRS
jgi:redox-sensitive bicupin YhaK (pirin superfamily)